MAELLPGFKFIGSLDDLTAFKKRGSDTVFLRKKGGVHRDRILHDDNYINTRRNFTEFGGASSCARQLKQSMGIGRQITELNIQGQFTGLLRKMVRVDQVSEWGRRNILLTRFPHLLQGFQFSHMNLFESVVQTPVSWQLSRASLAANIELPALEQGLNFFPLGKLPYYRWAITLGLAPDYFYREGLPYAPRNEYEPVLSKTIASNWQHSAQPMPTTSLVLDLNLTPPDDEFILLLTVSIHFGKMDWTGDIIPEPFAVGGRIVGVV